jgi:hypothetical protein
VGLHAQTHPAAHVKHSQRNAYGHARTPHNTTVDSPSALRGTDGG